MLTNTGIPTHTIQSATRACRGGTCCHRSVVPVLASWDVRGQADQQQSKAVGCSIDGCDSSFKSSSELKAAREQRIKVYTRSLVLFDHP